MTFVRTRLVGIELLGSLVGILLLGIDEGIRLVGIELLGRFVGILLLGVDEGIRLVGIKEGKELEG